MTRISGPIDSVQGVLAGLVDELRAVGIEVSVGEHLDAARALAAISLQDKEVVRAVLQSALVKRAKQLDAFNLLFDLYTAGGRQPGAELVAAMSDQELRDTLLAVIGSDDTQVKRLLADEYVRRFGGLAPGSPVAGVFTAISVNQAADLEGFRADLRAAIRRALVVDRGARAVRATMRVRLAEDIDIVSASASELEAIAAAIGPLVQRLTHILAQLAMHRRRKLSIRRTLHLAMGTGGVPFRLATEPARPPKPEIVVLCDMSGSVAAFSRSRPHRSSGAAVEPHRRRPGQAGRDRTRAPRRPGGLASVRQRRPPGKVRRCGPGLPASARLRIAAAVSDTSWS